MTTSLAHDSSRGPNLSRLIAPRSVAVVGASDSPGKVGQIVMRNLLAAEFAGALYPVNPRQAEVGGLKAFPSLCAIRDSIDLAVVCTPAATVPAIVRECCECNIGGAVVISAGFREAGALGRNLESEIGDTLRHHPSFRLIGPNCLGIIAPPAKLNASFAASMPRAGRLAFLSQSGALCTSVLDWARDNEMGFSCFVSVGNMVDVDFADLLDYLRDDTNTDAAILYIESISRGREFVRAAREFTRVKPLVAYKAGRFVESAHAAASHTGAMVASDDVFQAAFERAGVVRVFDIEDLFDCAELLAHGKLPTGNRLAIVTNAGGPGVMAVDCLIANQGRLAELQPATIVELNRVLPAYWSHGNPVDILGDAPSERFEGATRAVLADEGVDGVLVLLTPQAMTEATTAAKAVVAAAAGHSKTLLASWMGGTSVRQGIEQLQAAGIPAFATPEQAVRAFLDLAAYARYRQTSPATVFSADQPSALREVLLERFLWLGRCDGRFLSEMETKQLLSAYEVPVAMPQFARSADEAARIAAAIGFPVAMKVFSPQITHKSDIGGIALNLGEPDAVRSAFDRIIANAHRLRPNATITGVVIEPMVALAGAVELILGAKRDSVFGATIMFGFGGIATELFRDRVLTLAPVDDRLVREMLPSLRSWPLLNGFRGAPKADVGKLSKIIVRFAQIIVDFAEIQEIEINPLLVAGESVIALDARALVRSGPLRSID